jgi:hypothetical protein
LDVRHFQLTAALNTASALTLPSSGVEHKEKREDLFSTFMHATVKIKQIIFIQNINERVDVT